MKRFFTLLLAGLMIVPFALADSIDLSVLSFDELRELQTNISKELITRPEWKEVYVPAGLYKVGVDIPAGDWCLKYGSGEEDLVFIDYGKSTNESGTSVEDVEWFGNIYKEATDSQIDHKNVKMIDGYYLAVYRGSVMFTIPESADLGF